MKLISQKLSDLVFHLAVIGAIFGMNTVIHNEVMAQPIEGSVGNVANSSCDTLTINEAGDVVFNIASSNLMLDGPEEKPPVPIMNSNKICLQTTEIVGTTPSPCIFRYKIVAAECSNFNNANCNAISCAASIGTEYLAWDPMCG